MSGGHFNYAYHKIQTLAEDILVDLESHEDDAMVLSEEVKSVMYRFAKELEVIAGKAKAVEWYMSCDTDELTFLGEMGKPANV